MNPLAALMQLKFTPASEGVNWQRVETLVHGPGASDITSTARGADGNSAAFACMMALCGALIEPPIRVYDHADTGSPEAIPEHPFTEFLANPNPLLTAEELWFWKNWAEHLDGNAYLMKVRTGNATAGNVIQLWPISPLVMEPWTERGSRNFIDSYRLQVAPGQYEYHPVENVIHFRLGLDDRDMRRGLSPVKRLVRQVATDEEASKFAHAFLGNYGVPGVVIHAKGQALTEEQARSIKDGYKRDFGNEGRGNVGILNGDTTITLLGSGLKDLDTRVLHNIPETRIAAVIGVPPAIAGLTVGLEQSSNYASMREVREMFTEGRLTWLWRMTAARLNHDLGLLRDFDRRPTVRCAYDLNEVRALQEDRDKLYGRLSQGVQGKWITVNEARAEVGLPPIEGGDELTQPQPATIPREDDDTPDEDGSGTNGLVKAIKANGSVLAQFPELMQAIVEAATPAMEHDMDAFFNRQRRRLKAEVVNANGAVTA